jgi:cobalamin biosynthetic protein CobC
MLWRAVGGHVLPAPGTQILLPQVAMPVPGRAAILRTTYAEHRAPLRLPDTASPKSSSADQLGRADLAIVVNRTTRRPSC